MNDMGKNDGGPAFPVEVSAGADGFLVGRQTGNQSGFATGLSIRDYFAAKAMQGWMATFVDSEPSDKTPHGVAEFAYQIADAMLKARSA